MFRIIVGVLAAFVGFSFGHSIPKWMENKSKSATDMQNLSSSEPAHPVRKLLLRRKSLRKFKFGSQKSGKENAEDHGSLQSLKFAQTSPLYASNLNTRARTEHKKLKSGSQKSSNDRRMDESSTQGLDSAPNMPLCAANFEQRHPSHQEMSVNSENECHSSQKMCPNSNNEHQPHQEVHGEDALRNDSKLREPVFCKISSMQSMCGLPVVKEKSQMKQWKMKLLSLRSKAMASEKVWYEKFENEKCSGKLFALTPKGSVAKKPAMGKENESPQLTSTRKRDFSWSRSSSSRVGLLVEGPKSAFER